MKTIPFLFLLFALAMPFTSFAQDMSADDDVESALQSDELVASDEIAAITENAEIGEAERQEDVVNPEGENQWSLGGEDLPAEEFE